ncbi:hypothetical protein L1987_08794 [Smallanthus sonchifolius]|uniref:Uncharacterized protein n=1 Tax=Smallanthus sonchifolius TaxID=185202 RepID=A0ACB9JMR0_9ASTR|nr:hypothetical protein L1987_08794 [Smallanthus sonchifolius]
MDVFTTQALLHSVGVSKSQAILGVVAINWIIKLILWMVLGTLAKCFFLGKEKKFDFHYLMELGAGLELATAAAPQLVQPLASAANVAKVLPPFMKSLLPLF